MTPEQPAFTQSFSEFFLGRDKVPETVAEARARNLNALRIYFGANGKAPFDGSRFEFYAAAETDPDRITPADLVAVTLLSMEIRHNSGFGITTAHVRSLEERSGEAQHLLAAIPADRDLHDLSQEEYRAWVGAGSSGERLWALLRDEIGMYRVSTFKLIARKRPRLFPIADSRTRNILGNPTNWWESWYEALKSEAAIVEELRSLRSEAARTIPSIRNVSLLRIADIALWNNAVDTSVEELVAESPLDRL